MKNFVMGGLMAVLAVFAGAQTLAPSPEPTASSAARTGIIDTERTRIRAERSKLDAGFLAEDAVCYRKFLVNSCLGDVDARRREAMADLRRQEISLNDEERRIKGADQIRRTEEKSSPEKQQEAADRRAKAVEDYQSRIEREQKKQQDQATVRSGEQASSKASADRLKANQEKAVARSDREGKAAEEARKFNERQKEAQERRARHEQEQLKRTKPAAQSLPMPQ